MWKLIVAGGVVEGSHYAQERQVVDCKVDVGVDRVHVHINEVQVYITIYFLWQGTA